MRTTWQGSVEPISSLSRHPFSAFHRTSHAFSLRSRYRDDVPRHSVVASRATAPPGPIDVDRGSAEHMNVEAARAGTSGFSFAWNPDGTASTRAKDHRDDEH